MVICLFYDTLCTSDSEWHSLPHAQKLNVLNKQIIPAIKQTIDENCDSKVNQWFERGVNDIDQIKHEMIQGFNDIQLNFGWIGQTYLNFVCTAIAGM